MAKRNVFYSFHFDKDVFRVQQIRNMVVLVGDDPVSPNTWEEIKSTEQGVEDWINENLKRKTCLVVLVGEDTANRKWVKYEIKRACELDIPVVGGRIHNVKCVNTGYGKKGPDPFAGLDLKWTDGTTYSPTVYNPDPDGAYKDINENLASWIETAILEVK
ncbi:TIR domain-containing protein [Pseudomonas fluorescens]|uniref:TIR domain-containing protein n=1 Tax=Pseudomonas fluorescens TaxID=294 RepID=UPI003C26BE9D